METGIAIFVAIALLLILGVVVYKATTPQFLIELSSEAIRNLLPAIFKVSLHSNEWWDIQHKIVQSSSKSDREYWTDKLKELEAKEAKK